MSSNHQENLNDLRHSCAHLLAAAVMELYPSTKRTIGPSIENGFYYDFDFGEEKISEEDLRKIEERMRSILPTWKNFEKVDVGVSQARDEYKDNPYKLELIEEILTKEEGLTFYKSGGYVDLCRGGHSKNPSEDLRHFKLLKTAGAYWRGNEKNKMLTRIYGTCFPTKEELDKYLWQLTEAEKRDHRKLGIQLDLFHFQPEAPGIPFWHPKGYTIRNELINFSRQVQSRYGYKEVQTPIMLDVEIFKTSGHWDHYHNDMFFTEYEEGKTLGLKPMNCPGMIQIYKSSPKSYRDLPLYLSEYGVITRKEKSGELNGMFRVMQATQDDAHLFVTPEGISEALEGLISLVSDIYKVFGIEYKAFLSTRPDDFMGSIDVWNSAETTLKKAMENAGLEVLIREKDGAFYGPKIDYRLSDCLGRTWQCATLQLDFQMPETFSLEYTGVGGRMLRPVMIHRTIIGSFERFMGIITEHYAGAFPVWLSPIQAKIIPISDKFLAYAQTVESALAEKNIRVEIDDRSETMSAKIRDAQLNKIPYMIIVGQKEIDRQAVSVRLRDGRDLGSTEINELINKMGSVISKRSLDLVPLS